MPSPATLARAFGVGRALFGVALVAAPDRFTERWLGPQALTPAGRTLCRGLGIRDVALGAGAAVAPGDPRPWLAAAALADLGDLLATGLQSAHPTDGRVLTVALAGGSVVAGAWLVRELSD